MEGESGETKKCGLCGNMIPVEKFKMHDIGCSRQNYKCKDCGMCVAKCDKDEHEETAHVPIQCSDCSFSAPSFKYGNHSDTCKMKPKECDWCSKIIKVAEWDSHRKSCGSKTKKCENCGDYVQNADWKNHVVKNICA